MSRCDRCTRTFSHQLYESVRHVVSEGLQMTIVSVVVVYNWVRSRVHQPILTPDSLDQSDTTNGTVACCVLWANLTTVNVVPILVLLYSRPLFHSFSNTRSLYRIWETC